MQTYTIAEERTQGIYIYVDGFERWVAAGVGWHDRARTAIEEIADCFGIASDTEIKMTRFDRGRAVEFRTITYPER